MIQLMLLIVLYHLIGVDVNNDIDYEDIYDINNYEYPYNHINRDDKLK